MSRFKAAYAVLSTDSWSATKQQKETFEQGSNIILPEIALQLLNANQCILPYHFELRDASNPSYTAYAGVTEFSLEENMVIIPKNILQQLHHPSIVTIAYALLPLAQSIVFYPSDTNFIQQNNYMTHIRTQLCNIPCLSICDTLHITINHQIYTLTVTELQPISSKAVSLHNRVDSVDIKLVKEESDQEDQSSNDYPLLTTITSTNNGTDNMHTMGASDDDMDTQDSNDDEWAAGGDWGDDADLIESYDGQDYLPFKPKDPPDPKEYTPPLPDPMSTDDGNSRKLKPVPVRAQHRAWICEHCHAINNLLESMKRQYACVSCDGKYRPGQAIIESKEEDEPVVNGQFEVWLCPCSKMNLIKSERCDLCCTKKPDEGIISFWTDELPVISNIPRVVDNPPVLNVNDISVPNTELWSCSKCNWRNTGDVVVCRYCNDGYNGNGNKNYLSFDKPVEVSNKIQYRQHYDGCLNPIGKVRSIIGYPVLKSDRKINSRLCDIFGKPYRNSCMLKDDEWIKDNKISHCIMRQPIFSNKYRSIGPRCIALNEETGDIAMMVKEDEWQCATLSVLRPFGGNGVKLMASLSKVSVIKNLNRNDRIRFVGDSIYVFSSVKYKVFVYHFDEKENEIMFVTEIFEPYFSEAMIVDIMVTKKLLIVLFDRWIGVYTLYPALEWFHAVSFSQNDNVFVSSMEMRIYEDIENDIEMKEYEEEEKKEMESVDCIGSIKNYIFINCENKLIAIHPSNPTFHFMHIADNVKNGSSYCNSKKYGTFYIGNEEDRIYQSWKYEAMSTRIICSLEYNFVWNQFEMIPIVEDKQIQTKDVEKFEAVLYDEMFGISGRLMVQCTMKKGGECMFYQLYNHNELDVLKSELSFKEYCLMPGTNEKPFNLIVFVFEMLYGTDTIDALIQSPHFNSVYAYDIKEDNAMIKMEDRHNRMNNLLQIGSKCSIYVDKNINISDNCDNEGKWYDGIVVSQFINDDNKEFVKISYLDKSVEYMYKYDKKLKYNEPILLQQNKWNIGDMYLYYVDDDKCWVPAQIVDVWRDVLINTEFVKIKYDEKLVQIPIDDDISVKLYKLSDVVKEKEIVAKGEVEHDGIMNRNGEEDDGEEDMEIELEGVEIID